MSRNELSWSEWRRRARTTGPALNQPPRGPRGRFVARPKPPVVLPSAANDDPGSGPGQALADVCTRLGRIERGERERADDFTVALNRIERMLADDRQRHARDSEELARLIRHIVGIKRHLGLIEQPAAPRISRRRPLQ